MDATKKLYDTDSHMTTCTALVLGCEYDEKKKAFAIILDQTVFFPEGGGQFSDIGFINDVKISDVQIKNDIITHYAEQPLEIGSEVTCRIDWDRRFDFMQQHSAEHILSGLVYKTYGYNNVGFHLGMTETTLDFDGLLTPDEIMDLEIKANEAVYKGIAFDIAYPDRETLANLEYRSKKELTGAVRIVTLPDYDVCACCAPHVYHTGEIGVVKIVNAMAHRGGIRLTIVCGMRAVKDYRAKQLSVETISALLSAKQPEVASAVAKQKNDQSALTARINDLQKRLLDAELRMLPAPETTQDILLFQKDLDTKAIRNAVNELSARYSGYCGIFLGSDEAGYNFILGSTDKDCRTAYALLKEHFSAKGGGNEKMIQGTVQACEAAIRSLLL